MNKFRIITYQYSKEVNDITRQSVEETMNFDIEKYRDDENNRYNVISDLLDDRGVAFKNLTIVSGSEVYESLDVDTSQCPKRFT